MANVARAIFKASTGAAVASISKLRKEMAGVGESANVASGGIGKIASVGKLLKAGGAVAGVVALGSAANMLRKEMTEWSRESIAVTGVMANLKVGIGGAREATKGYIDDLKLAESANKAVALGVVSSTDEFTKYAGAVQKITQRYNLGADAIEGMTEAIGKGSALRFDNFNLTVDHADALERYAASIGTTVKRLTDKQKTEALQKAMLEALYKAADTTAESYDGLRGSLVQLDIWMQNLHTRMKDQRTPTERVAQAMNNLSDEVVIANREAIEAGRVSAALTVEMEKLGASTSDQYGESERLEAMTIRLATALRRQARSAEDAHDALKKKILTEQQGETQKIAEEKLEAEERELEYLKAKGAKSDDLLSQQYEIIQAKAAAGKLDQAAYEHELRMLGVGGGGGGGGKRGPKTSEVAAAGIEALAAQERELIDINIEAQSAFIDGRLEMEAEKRAEAEEAHKERMLAFEKWVDDFDELQAKKAEKRAAEEAARLKQRTVAYEGWSRGAVDATMMVSAAGIAAAMDGEKSAAMIIANQARGAAVQFGLEGLKYTLMAGVHAAAWNFPQAAADLTAAGQAFAGSAVMGATAAAAGGVASSQASRFGGGGGSGRYAVGPGASGGGGGGQAAPPSPVSPLGGSSPVPGSTQGSGTTIVVQGSVISEGDLLKAMRNAKDRGLTA